MNTASATAAGTAAPHASVSATRDRILDAAEELFATQGIDATSVRDIIAAANANLGAINYHFGTKQKLISAVITRRLEPLTKRRVEALDRVMAEAGERAPTVESILSAFLRSIVEQTPEDRERQAVFMRLMARCHFEANTEVQRLAHRHLERIAARVTAALRRALPKLGDEEVSWRIRFVIGALNHAMIAIAKGIDDRRAKATSAEVLQRLVAFTAAGMRAPSTRILR